MNFCSHCGGSLDFAIPPGDDHKRYICTSCRMIHYQNPRMVVGTIPAWQNQILLCRRDIEPRRGLWTLPAGYLENGESVRDGAIRESREEACCELTELAPYYLADLVKFHQVYLMFRSQLIRPDFAPTRESSEVRLFFEAEIPWEQLAFQVIRQTLQHYFRDRAAGIFHFRNETVTLPSFHTSPSACGK